MTVAAEGEADTSLTEAAPSPGAIVTERLERAVVTGPSPAIARSLLGALLVRDIGAQRLIGRIVETEAYAGPADRASHARYGRTPRTVAMFGPPGRAYVYFVYGLHHCLNVVCAEAGEAGAVLIRAIEPLAGLDIMRRHRGVAGSDARLAAGPARLCQALDIDRRFDGVDLLAGEQLWLARDASAALGRPLRIVSGPRIGVAYAGPEWASRPWRYGIADSRSLSRPFPAQG